MSLDFNLIPKQYDLVNLRDAALAVGRGLIDATANVLVPALEKAAINTIGSANAQVTIGPIHVTIDPIVISVGSAAESQEGK